MDIITRVPESAITVNMNVSRAANEAADISRFVRFQDLKSKNTNVRHKKDLEIFEEYLRSKDFTVENLFSDVDQWRGISWGLVEGFKYHLLNQGYAISSINLKISAIKDYASMARESGVLTFEEESMIDAVKAFSKKEGIKLDEKRTTSRISSRKEKPTEITEEQANVLKNFDDNTDQGIRNCLLMCILLDHGLRVGEVALLKISKFDAEERTFEFWRPKVSKWQVNRMTEDTFRAFERYQKIYGRKNGLLFASINLSTKKLDKPGLTVQAISSIVTDAGAKIGVRKLSPHDLRHYWATQAALCGTELDALMKAGGWSTATMPLRYINDPKIANERVKLKK